MSARRINGRVDEQGNPHAYQISFRTTRALSGAWSSLRGLCRRYGRDEATPELFEKVVMPSMREYVSRMGYLDRAKEERKEAAE